jgi:uncharacterized protein YbaP (TraB family)
MHMNRFLTLAARWSTRGLYALLFWLPAFAAHAQNGSTPVIWEARSATNTVYLFGTIHVGARKMYPLSPAVEKAFAASSVLALEADPTDPSSAMDGMANAAYQPPDNIARHISPELMAKIEKVLPQVGLPIEYARLMRPALLAMTIAVMEISRQGYDPALGLDMHFAKLAKQQGKRIVELESLADQLALLQSFSPALQAGMLEQSVDSVQSGALMNELRELVAAWRTGDPDGLMGQLKKDTEDLPPELAKEYERLLYQDRNEGMATKVIAMLEGSEPTFVAVGAGHLLGPTGLVELLQAKGYKLRRL